MTQPLSLPEVRQIEKLRADVNKIGSDLIFRQVQVIVNEDNRELWLTILDLALEANEGKQKEWRHLTKEEERAMMYRGK